MATFTRWPGAGVGDFLDVHRVNEAEVDDVDGDLGVEDLAELGPDGGGVGRAIGEGGGGDLGGGDGFAEGVAVFAVDAEEAEVGLHGVAAAEGLVNHHLGVGVERGFVAGGNLGGDDFAGEDAVFGGHGGNEGMRGGVRGKVGGSGKRRINARFGGVQPQT
jgi:hypothetical protein